MIIHSIRNRIGQAGHHSRLFKPFTNGHRAGRAVISLLATGNSVCESTLAADPWGRGLPFAWGRGLPFFKFWAVLPHLETNECTICLCTYVCVPLASLVVSALPQCARRVHGDLSQRGTVVRRSPPETAMAPKRKPSAQKALMSAGFWPMLPKTAIAVGKYCSVLGKYWTGCPAADKGKRFQYPVHCRRVCRTS